MLHTIDINKNKEEFINLLKSIKIENANIEGLINFLELRTDFFTAPASTKYHCCYKGGLCEHSLNVYKKLKSITENYSKSKYNEDSLIICGLLHDISKSNYYEEYIKNEKKYSDDGTKYDSKGNFEWVSTTCYKVRDASERAVGFTHETMSTYLVQRFIPLTYEEAVAISNHSGSFNYVTPNNDLNAIFTKYPLALLLHVADMLSCYIDESTLDE